MKRNLLRMYLLICLLLFSHYSIQHPIFRELNLSERDGEQLAIYYTKVLDHNEFYTVKIGLSKNISVHTNANLKKGDTVSFYGTVKDGRLYASKYRIHSHPHSPYYLSIIGLLLFVYIIRRDQNA
jgi:hypothetical protein